MRECQAIVDFLRDEFGDGIAMVVTYDADDYDIVHGEQWYEEYLETADTRSPEKMHENALSEVRQADAAGELYDNEMHAKLQVTERGTGCNLLLAREEGVFLWFAPEADVSVPAVVEECLERVGPSRDAN